MSKIAERKSQNHQKFGKLSTNSWIIVKEAGTPSNIVAKLKKMSGKCPGKSRKVGEISTSEHVLNRSMGQRGTSSSFINISTKSEQYKLTYI